MNTLILLRRIGWMVALLGTALACMAAPSTGQALPLTKVADVPLGGGTTRMDYASLDPGRHLLFIAHLGDSAVIVFDTQAQKVVARIAGISHVHGVLAIPALGRVYATATGTDQVVAIDEATFKVVARAPAGVYPDGMAYAPEAHKLYVSDETGGTDTVIDVRTNARVATIPLDGQVGNTQYDPVSRHIFANVQTRAQLAEIDPATDRVIARIDLAGAQGNHGLLIVPAQRLAFIACEDNARLLVLNLASRRVVATFAVGGDPDVLAIDPQLGWIYVAGEAGIVSVFKAQNGTVTKIGEGMLGPNAHVVAVDPISHRTYFPLKNLEGRTALRIMQPRT
ncbi:MULTISPECIES: YncE family protein [unclassified Rhodanobacter]|uniref:YncE family protein n=1 Tax=Rhodanobacter humi TaxID=1888173 RepID=A0ABV4AK73_9GAMM